MSSYLVRSLAILLGCLAASTSGQQSQLLMVFGGYDYSANVSLLSLDGGPPVPECLQNLNPLPVGLSLSCAATLGSGKLPSTGLR